MDERDEPVDEQDALKKKLGIESFKDFAPEMLPAFVAEIPHLSKDAAMAVVRSLPDFKELMQTSMTQVQEQATGALKANWKSQKRVHAGFAEYRAVIDRELERDNLSSEERLKLLELYREGLEREARMNQDHQGFALKLVGTVASVVTVGFMVGIAAVAAIGGQMSEKEGGKDDA